MGGSHNGAGHGMQGSIDPQSQYGQFLKLLGQAVRKIGETTLKRPFSSERDYYGLVYISSNMYIPAHNHCKVHNYVQMFVTYHY